MPSVKIGLLIADDHALVREAIRNAFERHKDIEILAEVGDGEAAVKMTAELRPDIVIMDIVMPKLSGIEATRQIRVISPDTAVLILTSYDDDRYVVGLLESGAAGYLLKSARGQDLVKAVRVVHAGESVLHPKVIAKILRYSMHPQVHETKRTAGETLSTRELQVLKLAAKGMSNKEIAEKLCVSTRTAKAHLSNIFNRLAVASRTEAIIKGLREGWLTLEDLSE